MHTEIVPMVLLKSSEYVRQVSLKLKPDNFSNTLDDIQEVHVKFDPATTPEFRFVDEMFDQQYQQEQRLGTMIRVFTAIAIFIACLGLIGMVGFIIETKTKEIGIRKVLGASVQSIWMMISSHFFVLISIAFVLATPVSYWLMQGWLNDFEYRTNISVISILSPLFVACIFTIITVSYQSIKASIANPVDSLKDE